MSGILVPKPMLGRQLRKGHRSARGLVGHWLFNEGAGKIVFDLSGNGNTGTLIDDTHWVPSKFGSCLEFDGVSNSDYVDCGEIEGLQGASVFTVVVWHKSTVIFNELDRTVIGAIQSGGNKVFILYQRSNGKYEFKVFKSDGSSELAYGNTVIIDNAWHQIVGVWDGVNLILYIDVAKEIISPAFSGVLYGAGQDPLLIGKGSGSLPGNSCQGLIDHVLIYNRALSASEMAELYLRPFAMFEREPLPLWTAATQGVAAVGNPWNYYAQSA